MSSPPTMHYTVQLLDEHDQPMPGEPSRYDTKAEVQIQVDFIKSFPLDDGKRAKVRVCEYTLTRVAEG